MYDAIGGMTYPRRDDADPNAVAARYSEEPFMSKKDLITGIGDGARSIEISWTVAQTSSEAIFSTDRSTDMLLQGQRSKKKI